MKTARPLTVSELTTRIRKQVESVFTQVWVVGEISNLRTPLSGHYYFTMKDASSQIRAVLFRSVLRTLRFRPEDGQQFLCTGHLTVYEPRGEYQIVVEGLEPKGIGTLQLAFEQLKAKLESEGLFRPERKKPLPVFARKIGLVTSPTGAVVRDILQILERRAPNLSVLIAPVAVQGESAPGEIARAIGEFSTGGDVEVVILARGGGSLEDLWAFNDERVVRAIADSRLPVISAVGHETDYTIADFVADLRAPTPSAAAELVVRSKSDWTEQVLNLELQVRQAIRGFLDRLWSRIREEERALPHPRKILEAQLMRLDDLGWRLHQAFQRMFQGKAGMWQDRRDALMCLHPASRLRRERLMLDRLGDQLQWQMLQALEGKRGVLKNRIGQMDSLSPLAVLSRGYSIARRVPDLQVIREVGQVRREDRLNLRLSRGELVCRVEQVKETAPES